MQGVSHLAYATQDAYSTLACDTFAATQATGGNRRVTAGKFFRAIKSEAALAGLTPFPAGDVAPLRNVVGNRSSS